ncbi:LOW QUALITY PROTEIN: E3 ubiquitin-protein ligase rnf213-alpha [Callorhinchus milii]|uniref:LOW QUALITY PROTEIN: E3 ubiquitin-protein ligase rnf213-alpha n=1 Tax=Callorhinchus milii TaxID=7868 RepID=UPI001C3F7057|nr:LOW QUALITY PROTEIN: E3 ubiquitin-protein ligase rnf213-alpha [Callorhinchus milii]
MEVEAPEEIPATSALESPLPHDKPFAHPAPNSLASALDTNKILSTNGNNTTEIQTDSRINPATVTDSATTSGRPPSQTFSASFTGESTSLPEPTEKRTKRSETSSGSLGLSAEESAPDSTPNENLNPQDKANISAAGGEGVATPEAQTVDQNIHDTQIGSPTLGTEAANQKDTDAADRSDEKRPDETHEQVTNDEKGSVTTKGEKHSLSQTDSSSCVETSRSKRKKRKRHGKKKKNKEDKKTIPVTQGDSAKQEREELPTTAITESVTTGDQEQSVCDPIESCVQDNGETLQARVESTQPAVEQPSTEKAGKELCHKESAKQQASSSETDSSKKDPETGDGIKKRNEKRRRQHERKNSQKRSKFAQISDMEEQVAKPAADQADMDPRRGGEIRAEVSELQVESRDLGASQGNTSQREDTTKQMTDNNQSTSCRGSKGGSVQETHKGSQTEGGTKTEDNKNVSEAKAKQEDKKQSSDQNQTATNPYPLVPDMIIIHVHVMLPKRIRFNENCDILLILDEGGSIEVTNCSVRNYQDCGYLIQGHLYVGLHVKGASIPYWYGVRNRGEFIQESALRHLQIPSDLTENEWHQYDDIAHFPESRFFSNFRTFWSNPAEKIVHMKCEAGRIMLQTIFELLCDLNNERIKQFLTQLRQFQHCYQTSTQRGWYPDVSVINFSETQVKELICEQLKRFLAPHTQVEATKKAKSNVIVKNRFRDAILAFQIRNNCSLQLDKSVIANICHMLQLPQKRTDDILQHLEEAGKLFSPFSYICVGLINYCIQEEVVELVLIIPLLHWFLKHHQPHEADFMASKSAAFCNRIKSHPDKRSKLLELVQKNKPLTETDPTLVQSWLSLIVTEDIPEYAKGMEMPLKMVIIDLLHRLEDYEQKMNSPNFKSDAQDIQAFGKVILYVKDVMGQQQERFNASEMKETDLKLGSKIHEITCRLVKGIALFKVPEISFQLVMDIAERIQMFLTKKSPNDLSQEENQLHVNLKSAVEGAQDCLRTWITKVLTTGMLSRKKEIKLNCDKELEMWSCHLAMDCRVEEWTTQWRSVAENNLTKRIQKENPSDQIEIYWKEKEKLIDISTTLANCFETCALKAVPQLCQSKKEVELLLKLRPWENKKNPNILSKLIEESWQRLTSSTDGEVGDIGCVLSSDSALHCCLLQGDCSKLNVLEEARRLLTRAEDSFHTLVECLYEGSVKLADLKLVLQTRKEYIDLFQAQQKMPVSRDKCFFQVDVESLLTRRQKEYEALLREKECTGTLIKMINKIHEKIKVTDTAFFEEKYKANIQAMRLNELVRTKRWTKDEAENKKVVQVMHFNLSSDIALMADRMHEHKESSVLLKFWVEASEKSYHDELTLEDLQDSIWDVCWNNYENLCHKIAKGTVTFQEVDRMFLELSQCPADIKTEMDIMSKGTTDKGWTEKRWKQIKEYYDLHLAAESAEVIQDIVKKLELRGDFTTIQNMTKINKPSFKEKTLDYIDRSLLQTKQRLVKMNPECRKCLEEFIRCQEFIKWVKEALINLKEVKVFVDLASISAGENDMEIDRVACFHDAVMGYSPFIYDLQPDTDLNQLIGCAEKVWKALKNDQGLTVKLGDSARYLEWLKTLKESHGSVETSSLSLAAAINSKGVYTVGNNGRLCDKKVSLASILRLSLYDENTKEAREYTLEELQELLNKLMLMSGKRARGKEEVATFMENFSNVQRLGKAFIELYSSGNMLYRNWKAFVHCDAKSEVCITMDFSAENIGLLTVDGNLSEQLEILCRAMELCLENWYKFMKETRARFYNLNYYTAEQIVYLCTELGALSARKPLPEQVMVMLSFVKPDCTVEDVRWATPQSMVQNESSEEADEDVEVEVVEVEVGEDEEVEEYSDTELEAYKCDSDDVDPCLSECSLSPQPFRLDHCKEVTEEMEFQQMQPPDTQGEETSNSQSPDMSSRPSARLLHSQKAAGLSEKIAAIWETFMNDMTVFLAGNLDVTNLGELLNDLSGLNKISVTRHLPPSLYQGRPNLVVCAEPEVFRSALCLYTQSPKQPLPTYDEVLVCSEKTTYEEAELFLRRALSRGSCDQKIYTLIHADRLTYDASVRFGDLFEELKHQSNCEYQFVVICDAKRQHCYIPSYFSCYKVHIGLNVKPENIQMYLQYHFTVPKERDSAARVFHDRLSVRIVSSTRPGVGKSLYVDRLHEKLLERYPGGHDALNRIRLIEPVIDENQLVQKLTPPSGQPRIFHIDAAPVRKRLEEFLFKILILGFLKNSAGMIWKRSETHLHIVELLNSNKHQPQQANLGLLGILPTVHCRTPREVRVLELRKRRHELPNSLDPLMDRKEFHSEAIQRPYQYLRRFSKGSNLDEFTHRKGSIEEDPVECLVLFLQYCGLRDPSWAELRNFSWFLNLQLKSCESSMFCNPTFVGDTLVGFKLFIVEFMIVMARDFATPSMSISDESLVLSNLCEDEDLLPYILRKRWETQSHPYIFFNADGFSMTFLGFHLRKNRGGDFNAVDHHTGEVLRGNVMSSQLHHGLTLQTIQFNEDFDGLSREVKIRKLSLVLGVTDATDPDTTYELTADNMMKMLAIHMRFRCGIPVIIMGETGCGKTRLIKFLCDLQKGKRETENMKLVKVHGGTTAQAIYAKIQEAEKMAILNKERHNLETILFFDEANTTEAIYAIKEVLCDKTIQGRAMKCHTGLKIIAACNPYRKHSEIMIKRLEMAGLGYRVKAEETDDKLGKVPLRQLVYRVQPLPPSMIPLVWDFGQLSDLAEVAYTKQIVQRYIQNHHLPFSCTQDIVKVLAVSQMFMRQKKDECSFVSLRDVERCMKVLVWFYEQRELLFNYPSPNINLLQALMLTVGVCYYPSLVHKGKYLEAICHYFPEPYNSPAAILKEIVSCQDRFLRDIKMRETIAKNEALKENVFLMVICIELRIPLFLVGKPGSSKSLAKTVVLDAMQGQAAHCDLFKHLKQVHMVSFQCSPHSTPEGIINTFKQCARFQQAKNLQEYVSVVVLDEIGLAEDSPQMPLKTLHPLLEDGCVDDDPSPHKKVGFIGISNWALDPAKMNRGIFVSRLDPCEKELIETAKGICSSGQAVLLKVQDLFPSFAKSYLEICSKQSGQFFGLRDYYSLVKMVFATAKESKCEPTDDQLAEAVLRNFSGKDQFSALDVFLPSMTRLSETSTLQMVNKNIRADGDCRYLLLLTKNYVALQLVQQHIFQELGVTPEIIFGSSFPKDQEYTQICRNVNRVKTCMETGSIVILLNLKNLYESLYDALNQYYVYLGEYQYVDLGLGTHRVKCRVDKKFRLIVVEDKDIVYEQFPIPLINRLEKHSLDMSTVLSLQQRTIVEQLEAWVKEFVAVKARFASEAKLSLTPSEVIIGFHSDACASVLLQVLDTAHMANEEICDTRSVFNSAKHLLLNCVTPDAVVRLKSSKLGDHEAKELWAEYFVKQRHRSLSDYIQQHLKHTETRQRKFVEVTTFSRLLTQSDIKVLIKELHVDPGWFRLLFLHQFDTEHSFCKEIRECILGFDIGTRVLLIQMDTEESSQSMELIASAKYCAMNEMNLVHSPNCFVYFVTKLSRVSGGSKHIGFQGGQWLSVHIDDLMECEEMESDMSAFCSVTISELFAKESGPPADTGMNIENETREEDQATEEMPLQENPNILNTTLLLQSCVQRAVGIIRDGEDGSGRSTERVRILLDLMREDGDDEECFLRMVKQRVKVQLQEREETSLYPREWMYNEALKLDALQEGGTFRHTLWKCIQNVVAPNLAQLISVLDRDYNLSLLDDPGVSHEIKKVWLNIFSDIQILKVSHQTGNMGPNTQEVRVDHRLRIGNVETHCAAPFSWLIKEYIDQLWVEFQFAEGAADGDKAKMLRFVDQCSKSQLGQYLECQSAEGKHDLAQRYLRDFILMTINISSSAELKVFKVSLISCLNELQNNGHLTQEHSPAWIHTAYRVFKKRLQSLSRTIMVYPGVLQALQHYIQETLSPDPQEMTLDICAAWACAERAQALDIVQLEDCKRLIETMETLQASVELVYDKHYIRSFSQTCQRSIAQVRSSWDGVLVLAVFIEHVVLTANDIDPRFLDIAVKHCSRLQKILRASSDLKKKETVKGVMGVLQSCNEEASYLDCKYGIRECPICLGVPKDPALLPCKHVVCIDHLRIWLQNRKTCPKCTEPVPSTYQIQVSSQLKSALKKHDTLRQKCNSFFMEVVSRFCFREDSPPSDEVITLLLSLLIAVRSCPEGDSYQTRTLTPFSECVDASPKIRSVLLKLMLHYSFEKVKTFMQTYLSNLEEKIFDEDDLKELYILFINCFEDSMYGEFERLEGLGNLKLLRYNCSFTSRFARRQVRKYEENAAEFLQDIARLRFCFSLAAQLMAEIHNRTDLTQGVKYEKEKRDLLEHIRMICLHCDNDWYRVYLVRTLYDQYGMDFIQSLLQREDWSWVFPDIIIKLQRDFPVQLDRFVLCGEDYQEIRDEVAKVVLNCQMHDISNKIKSLKSPASNQQVYLAMAFFREVTCAFALTDRTLHPSPKTVSLLQKFIEDSNILEASPLKTLCTALVANELGMPGSLLRVSATQPAPQRILTEIIIHAALVFTCGKMVLLAPLRNIAFHSERMRNAYFPTMPEDLRSEARRWAMKEKWYTCSNGHDCLVGECGRPIEESTCPDCGVRIGGTRHTPLQGFTLQPNRSDETQKGHILGRASKSDEIIAPDRQMTPVAFLLLRTLTHVSMMLGTISNSQVITNMIRPQVNNVSNFLYHHLENNLEQLRKLLGKNIDDTATCVHLVLDRLLNQPNERPSGWSEELGSKIERNAWEVQFIKVLISPLLKDLDKLLSDVGKRMSSDSRIGGSPIVKMLYGDPSEMLTFPHVKGLNCSSAWMCQGQISVEKFTHIVEQKDGKKRTPILWQFLQKERHIQMLSNLPDLLRLQYELIRTFQSAPDTRPKTIGQFLQQMPPGQRHNFERKVKTFIDVWNQLSSLLAKQNGKIPREFIDKDLTFQSPIEVLLPQQQGPGLCATELSKFLVGIQNDLLGAVNHPQKYSINPEEVSDAHLILCDSERDFIPLVLSNCQYTLEKGQETSSEYDILNVERQLIRQFLKGKPTITDSKVPKFVARHERDYSNIFKELKAKIPQESLPLSVCAAVTAVLKSYSDSCDALEIIEITVGFLATAGGAPDNLLLTYLKDTLYMAQRAIACVSKAFEGCRLKHTVSLWQLLSSWKSESMLGTNKDPFERIPKEYKEHLLSNEEVELRTFFANTDINTFLWELHEILVLKIGQPNLENKFRPDWSLRDTLSVYLESKGSDIPPRLEDEFPEHLLLEKSIQIWKLAANFKRKNR